MNVLDTAIKTFVSGFLDEASKRIADRFDVPIDDVMEAFSDLHLSVGNEKRKESMKETSNESNTDNEEVKGCIHRMIRGNRAGECCGEKISSKSQTGKYCSKHIARENKVQSQLSKSKKTVPNKSETEYRISKNKFGNYTHTSTGLVFRSAKEKYVYGRQDEDGEIHDLTEEDIELCKKYKFPIYKAKENEKSVDESTDEEKSDEEM